MRLVKIPTIDLLTILKLQSRQSEILYSDTCWMIF